MSYGCFHRLRTARFYECMCMLGAHVFDIARRACTPEVETFATALLTQRHQWKLGALDHWQRSLRRKTRNAWFPQKLLYDVVHRTNLRCDPVVLDLSLGELLKRQDRKETAVPLKAPSWKFPKH